MRFMAMLILGLGLLAVAGGPTHPTLVSPASADTRCSVAADPAVLDGEEQAALDLINGHRSQRGLALLAISPSLNRAAQWKSESMAGGTPFAHDDGFRSWAQRMRECGYTYSTWVRENIAAGNESAEATVGQWINSGIHRENMFDPRLRVIGIARRQGGVYGWYWTADFADSAADALSAGNHD